MRSDLFLGRVFPLLPLLECVTGQVGTAFTLYAYGNGLSGQQVFWADGLAVFANYTVANQTDNLIPVRFNTTYRQHPPPGLARRGYSVVALPDTAASVVNAATRSPPFTEATLYVPDQTLGPDDDHAVGFTPNTTRAEAALPDGKRYGGFAKMEQALIVIDEDSNGKPSLFCAFPSKANPDIWVLKWNVTTDVPERADGVAVTLRTSKYRGGSPISGWSPSRCMTRAYVAPKL